MIGYIRRSNDVILNINMQSVNGIFIVCSDIKTVRKHAVLKIL